MNYRLNVRNKATQDLRQAANYILVNGDSDSASRFLESIETTFKQLATTPGMGKKMRSLSPRLGEIRQWRVKDFNDYLIFYRIQEQEVDIIRLLHGARDLENVLFDLDEDI